MTKLREVVWVFLFLWRSCDSAYFDDQPKFLTENGNFVIESAVDRNITFRLKGTSYLNVNDLNVMTMIRNGGNQSIGSSSSVALRLSTLEEQIRQIPTGDKSRTRNRNLLQRLIALEGRVNNSGNSNITAVVRRIRTLETKVARILERLNSDACSSNPCKNGGTCTNAFSNAGYVCQCTDAWTGANCDEDVNECAIYAGTDLGCQNSISCENTPGGYNCRCNAGWQGIHCTKRTVDCLSSSAYELCGHGVCVHTNDPNAYRCICDQGWTSNGTSPACIVDINECETPAPHCSKDPDVPCINLPGSYTCGQCPHGYTGNGHYCKDVDECAENNGGCSMSPFVQCINTRGSSKCAQCPFGYSGDGRICIRTSNGGAIVPSTATDTPFQNNRCDNPSVCHPLATCVQFEYAVTCICPPHHTGNGVGPFGCTRTNLTTFDGCTLNPCNNGGTCVPVGTFGFRCECPAGTVGQRCATASSICSPNPCQNGGTCTTIGYARRNYRCMCPPGRTGRNCQTEARTCGGVLNNFNGTLKYPLSSTYPHNSRCAWLIKTDESKVLNITFTKFNLESSTECRFDWLQIHDGRSSASYMIGRFCGSELPKNGNIVSTQNMLYLWFRSDNSSAHDGFELKWNSTEPVCGGEIDVESHGTISSPGSPGNYPPNRDCIWKLSASPDKRIQLHFFTMQLEAHETCQYDYLAIHNGVSTDGDLLEKFCNTSHPEPLISPSNELTLHFHSDDDGNDAGFQIHYSVVEGIQGCGGTFTGKNGEFGSPIQNGAYPKNIECHYLIKMPRKNDTRVKLSFLNFKLEDSNSCVFDYVAIYDGNNENAPKVGKWCGNRLPPEFTSNTGEILVVFHTDFSFSDEGFRLKYETMCGGRFEEDNGEITSPWYPNPYEDNKNCVYDISAPLGKSIVLNFTAFNIENDCDFDSLKIYDGVDSNSTVLGTYCGYEKPPVAVSTLNHMHLIFSTDSSNTGPGFRAQYSFIDSQCGGVITKPNITIAPPSTDGNYDHSAECKWYIVAPPGKQVQLKFSSFELEAYSECRYDYLKIYDNIIRNETDTNTTPIGKYCGQQKPPVILSSSRALTLIFKSDESVNGQGFMATYDFIDGRNLCGGNFYAPTGTIISPNHPERYPGSRDCVYIINAPSGKQVELQIESFELEESNGCSFDSLEIRNGGNDKSPIIGTFCGTEILPRIKSFSNQMYLRFKSDSSNEYKGFKVNYNTATSGCGGLFTNAQSGTLSSPNYPEPYPANMQCDYAIQVARGSTIILLITDLNMEQTSECSFDYVSIYDGPNAASKLLGTYCHAEQIIQFESSSNNIFVRMVTDVNNQERGFEMRFRSNCNREIRDIRGAIESPNFPSNYPNYANCQWTLIPPMGNRVFLEFSHFDLEHTWSLDESHTRSPNCMFDHLTIEEHDSSNAMIIRSDKYCGIVPSPLNTSHIVVLKFESDFSNTAGGFHLEFEMQGCGGVLNKPQGSFTSPNYPASYPKDTHCQWVIDVDYGHLVEITFDDFDFEASSDCLQDGLIIANDANATKIINKFCGSRHSQKAVVTSTSNKVYVNFYSDLSYSGRGFTASYKSIAAKCGGTLMIPQGNITSPNYPNNYDTRTNCQWLLRTEASHTIQFQFSDFDLEDQSCTADTVRIYDGPEIRDDKLLVQACGSKTFGPESNETLPGFKNPLKSSSNEMLVVLNTDDSVGAKGFAAQFSTSCGSKINTSSSGILEIGHNLRWLADECEWTITANNPNQHVSLSIMHMDNEPVFQKYIARLSNQSTDACLRKVYVHDGSSTSGPKLAEICSNTHPPTITSEGNSLTLSLDKISDRDFAFTFDLKAYYSVFDNACGGVFGSVYGQIASPGYPKTYKNDIECEWTIQASPGNEMTLNIEMLDIPETEHCNGDYLEVREKNSGGKLVGVYCGRNIPPALTPRNTFWLKFRSDNDVVGRGFKIEYNYAKLVEQSGKSGVITSLMYPSYLYFTTTPYQWRITVEPGNLIRITIDNCILKRDSQIQIYDGYSKESGILQTIETDAIPTDATILSSTNVVLIEFEIPTFSESKFKLIWNSVPKSAAENLNNLTNSLNCSKNSIITVGEQDSIKLQSPGFPGGYGTHNCHWVFMPERMGFHVSASFVTIDLEVTRDCVADYVRVGSGPDTNHLQMTNQLCGMASMGRQSRFHGNPVLTVDFVSDFSVNRTGFEANVMLDCGGLMEGTQGEITNLMTVSNRSQFWMNETCNWEVSVARGRTIEFKFDKVNLAKNEDGSCNSYIIIRNGIHDDSPFLGVGKYCTDGPIPQTTGNRAIVQFVRNRVFRASNEFVLKYKQIEHDCGGAISLDYNNNSTIITSPRYPYIPSPHIECVWRLTAPNGELLKLEFLDRFDVTPSPTCSKEYVEVREGTTSTATVIGKYCGTKPLPIFSASNMVRVKFFTDVDVPKNGFKLQASFARCGKSIIANNGYISSPGYPGKGAYPTQTTCDYHITGRVGTVLNITFVDLNLPSAYNCSDVDHIIIYSIIRNGNGSSTNTEVTKVCGDDIPDSILTYSSNTLLRFVTKSSNSLFSGFRLNFQSTIDICGSKIEASSGIIQSPGYPNSQDASRYCEWMITVPKGRRVKVEVLDFDVKPSSVVLTNSLVFVTNADHRISFYNDFQFASHITTLIANNQSFPLIYSSDNTLAISALLRRTNVGRRGFKLRFTSNEPTICEGNLNGNEGSFQSPSSGNITRFYCEFVRDSHRPFFASQPGIGTLSIKVTEELSYSNRSICTPNLPTGISAYFSPTERRAFYTRCPAKYDNIASPFPQTKLTLRSVLFHKYRMAYKVHNCGGIFTDAMTAISIPTLATNYGELDCAWQYTTNTDQNIQMIVNTPAMNCDTEYLNIYRGRTPNRPKVQRFCGEASVNRTIAMNGQHTFIEYHTDNYNPSSKFDIKIITSDGICGGTLVAPNYAFSSPKNGTKYPANTECEWIIRAQSGYHVGLTFPDRFMIETSVGCKKDYVKVYDKVSGLFKEIYTGCGRDAPKFLNSTGQEMKVLFHTDDNGDGDGFSAQWTENCGGVFKATNFPQFITSPRFPDHYPKNIVCNYSIVADQGQSVQVRFTHFDLESTNGLCSFDNITIYKDTPYMFNAPMEEVGTYCTNSSVTTFRHQHRIDVVFRTDSFIERTGFKFEYHTDQCGGNITAPQTIQSLRDPSGESYLPMSSCVWFITAPSDKRVVVRFEELELEHLSGCYVDHVDVYEGHSTTPNMSKAKLCGNLTGHAPSISIDSNKATVQFTTDATVNEKGFSALILFVSNCNEHINLTTAQRRYMLNKLSAGYDTFLNCEYFVTAPRGYVIQARFNQMHLADCETVSANNSCGCDYLNIRDGYGPFAESFGTFCGHTNPRDILTTSGNLYMRFVTDNVVESTGFLVDLEMVESPCGPTQYHLNSTTPSVTIRSPMNGNVYKPNMNCKWQFTTSDENIMDFRFEQFDVEDDPNRCANDFLEISDGEDYVREGLGENIVFSGSAKSKNQYFYWGKQWPTASHRYCGNNTPIDYFSSPKTVYVQFKSNEVVERSGFKFTANILPDCARNYTKSQGRIFSKYLSNCESYISVPENKTISLYFTSMNFLLSGDCTPDNTPLKVYDGRNNELLESYCVNAIPKPLFTNTNLLRLKFRNVSMLFVPNDLYDITYLATDKGRGCGGELYNYGGTFSSPGYPNTDRNNTDCTWTIDVPMNLFVALQFSEFDMGPRSTCELNYVEIIENDETIPPTKFCGTDNPAPYKAKSNQLKVHFKSSMNFAGTGWVASFMAIHENAVVNNF